MAQPRPVEGGHVITGREHHDHLCDLHARAALAAGAGQGQGPCPTCTGPVRETTGLVCQTCGYDYAQPAPVSEEQVDAMARAIGSRNPDDTCDTSSSGKSGECSMCREYDRDTALTALNAAGIPVAEDGTP